ncbi:MAG TPA: cobalt transporter [Rhodospirillaceae bacterium]|nr:cobalt transporter [Magnetovibrio sp.]HBT44249.1 cobalt transporter [Rhodospirillaceae bacterium]HCS68957.1 cobalt transporter [Rhodospirillaceae bacterium]|tara:strand:- start:2 stop:748 length:747 start_codon:yes stop_codon:yes gene_type:complete
MTGRIFAVALLAGLAAGLAVSVLQHFTTTPIILHAETFEGKPAASLGGHAQLDLTARGLTGGRLYLAHGAADHGSNAEAQTWSPEDGLERTLFTSLTNVLTAIGFALVLTAVMFMRGRPVDGRQGVIWGMAGFAVVSLAPALGLPPEVPGAMAAELTGRQEWWVLCAVLTAGGLGLMFLSAQRWMPWAGAAMLALPHVLGAPQADAMGGAVPPELAAHFVAASLVTAAAFWAFLGFATGTLAKRFKLT